MSYRQQVTNAFKARLLGNTIAGNQVLTSLDRKLDPAADLPAIMVYVTHVHRGDQDYGNNLIPRLLTVVVEAAVLAPYMQEIPAANDFADQIEAAIEADRSLGHVVHNTLWQKSLTDATSHGELTMGVCLLEYQVEMLTNERAAGYWEFHDDGFTTPPGTVYTVPATDEPPPDFFVQDTPPVKPDPNLACGPDGCDVPAWGGEVQP